MRDSAQVAHSNDVINALESLEAQLRDTESAQRGYLITQRPTFLNEYRTFAARVPHMTDELVELVADNPSQTTLSEALRGKSMLRLQQMNRTVTAFDAHGLDAARQSIANGAIDTSVDIRVLKERLIRAERLLLAKRASNTRKSATLLMIVALLGIPVGIGLTLYVYSGMRKEIARRARAEAETEAANSALSQSVSSLEIQTANLVALTHFASMLQSTETVAEAHDLTGKILQKLFPDVQGAIYSMRHSKDFAERTERWGDHPALDPDRLTQSSCYALRRDQMLFCESPNDPSCAHFGNTLQDASSACLPVSAQGVQLGMIVLVSKGPPLSPQANLLGIVAEQYAMSLANLHLQDRLKEQSIRDPLTGLFNRRYLEESMTREVARARRRNMPISILMLDIDHFKTFNDVHGHAGGDQVIAAVGQLLKRSSRTEDIACRYGGEEFTLIMPDTPHETALHLAERLRAAMENERVALNGVPLPPISASIGVASALEPRDSGESIIRAADEALYRAKRLGRNRVESAGLLEPESAVPRIKTV